MRKKFAGRESSTSSGYISLFKSPEEFVHHDEKGVELKYKYIYNLSTFGKLSLYISIGLLVCILIYGLGIQIHTSTYVWQSTTLATIIKPIQRQSCPLPVTTLNTYTVKPSKIAIIMLYDDQNGSWNPKLMQRVIGNRHSYCKRHGYDVLIANDFINRSRPVAWSKLLAVQYYLQLYEYVVYMDMDIVIMNYNIKLEDIITSYVSSQELTNIDFIMTSDWGGPNTGVWITKKSNFSTWFLQTAWDEGEQFIEERTEDGIAYPFEFEQRVFHYMLNSEIWQSRQLPPYPSKTTSLYSVDTIRSHFKFIPQCTMNSYTMHPFYWKGDREYSQYIPGDFLIHFAGKKGRIKSNLIKYYLTVSEKENK